MNERFNALDAVSKQLKDTGLSVRADGERLLVGTEHRGDGAPVAIVELPSNDTAEYLQHLADTGPRPGGTAEEAVGYLGTLVLESLISVHDGENNLTDRVSLRRGPNGHLGLHEHRIAAGEPPDRESGPLRWTTERP